MEVPLATLPCYGSNEAWTQPATGINALPVPNAGHLRATITTVLSASASREPSFWLALLSDVIFAAGAPPSTAAGGGVAPGGAADGGHREEEDDEQQYGGVAAGGAAAGAGGKGNAAPTRAARSLRTVLSAPHLRTRHFAGNESKEAGRSHATRLLYYCSSHGQKDVFNVNSCTKADCMHVPVPTALCPCPSHLSAAAGARVRGCRRAPPRRVGSGAPAWHSGGGRPGRPTHNQAAGEPRSPP